MKLKDIAEKLELPLKGNPDIDVKGVKDLEHPEPANPDYIYFLETKKHMMKYPKASKIRIVLTTKPLSEKFQNALIAEENVARIKFVELLSLFEKKPSPKNGISPNAYIDPSAKLGKNVTIMQGVVVMENVSIGDGCVLYPNVVIEPGAAIGNNTTLKSGVSVGYNCEIGEGCLIHANTVIGADGFGFFDKAGKRYKIPQIGNVVIGNDVEMGACCTIDRAAIESTLVGDHTKFDDRVHVGHNCRVGKFVFIAGGTVLAGSVTLEDRVIIGGQSAIAEHLTMKQGSILFGLSGLTEDSKENTAYFGIPALPALEMHRIHALLPKIPDLMKRVKTLEEK